MNIRILVLFAALLPFIVYVAGVLGGMNPGCTEDRVPQDIPCPVQPTSNCSNGAMRYTYQKQWLIASNSTGVYVASSPGASNVHGTSFEANMIVETGATCGGRYVYPFAGPFGSSRFEGSMVMQSTTLECYFDYNCNWTYAGTIKGYAWRSADGGGQEALETEQTQQRCDLNMASISTGFAHTVVIASDEDCMSE